MRPLFPLKITSIDLPFTTANPSALGGALPSSQINAVLSKMLSVTHYWKNIYLRTNPSCSYRSRVDKTTLINAGNEVSTD
jgi:hypothetical protein